MQDCANRTPDGVLSVYHWTEQEVDIRLRPIPNKADFSAPLEACIRSKFLPIIVANHTFTDIERDIYSLPTRFGGLAVLNPVEMCPLEYSLSRRATKPLTKAILNQQLTFSPREAHEMNQQIK